MHISLFSSLISPKFRPTTFEATFRVDSSLWYLSPLWHCYLHTIHQFQDFSRTRPSQLCWFIYSLLKERTVSTSKYFYVEFFQSETKLCIVFSTVSAAFMFFICQLRPWMFNQYLIGIVEGFKPCKCQQSSNILNTDVRVALGTHNCSFKRFSDKTFKIKNKNLQILQTKKEQKC